MISSIFNELSVQIVSDPFPKPKQFSNLIRCHQCQSPCTNQFQAFRSFPFPTSITVHKTNTNPTGIFFLPFYPSLPSSKHKYKSNRHFVLPFSSKPVSKQIQIQVNPTGILFLPFHPKPVLKQITITANTNADTKQIKATTKTTDSKLKAYAGQAVPPTAPILPAPRPSSSRAPTCRSYSTRTTRSPSSRPEPQRSDQVARGAA